ncbi:hypothetical protein C8R44DRAFT_724408 [Mycena epipterygia]|nr:hypothetical protein C8R44DRAFT_724408 [Mycena epipterygia]
MSPKNTRGLNVLAMDSSDYCVGEDGKFPDDSEYMAYSLNFGTDTGSACPTPLPPTPRPVLRVRIDRDQAQYTSSTTSSSSATSTSYSSRSASPFSAAEIHEQFEDQTPYAYSLPAQDDAFPARALHSLLGARSEDTNPDKDARDGLATRDSLSDVLGAGNTLFALARAAGCVLVLGVLAMRGQWA